MSCEITDQYLDKLYDNITREETRLMTSLMQCKDYTEISDKDIQRQCQLLHAIAHSALKLKIFRKKQASKFI
jgi:hypothetical protein